MKKIIAFDQDDTLNITKLPVDAEMAQILKDLLAKFKVAVISGTNWEVMRKNEVDPLVKIGGANFENLIFLPTTGTQYWHFVGENFAQKSNKKVAKNSRNTDENSAQNSAKSAEKSDDDKKFDDGWLREYAHFLSDAQVAKISESLEKAAKKLNFWCENPAGEIIENRGSQITFSALGQWATPEDKHAWDADMKKRQEIVKIIEPELSEIGVKIGIGGATSIDITLPGIDKAYGMQQLMKMTGVKKSEILFIGDKLQPGGNDFPVKNFGIDTIEVRNCEDTKWVLRGILGVS